MSLKKSIKKISVVALLALTVSPVCGQDLFRFKPAAPGRHPHSVIYGSGAGLASEKTSLHQNV